MILSHKKVLVTGAGGFIGSHLTERLTELGASVTAFIHYNSRNYWVSHTRMNPPLHT